MSMKLNLKVHFEFDSAVDVVALRQAVEDALLRHLPHAGTPMSCGAHLTAWSVGVEEALDLDALAEGGSGGVEAYRGMSAA